MYVIRPIKESDLDQFYTLAKQAAPGMTSLPKDEKALKRRLEKSVDSFSSDITKPGEELYNFVLEELETGKIAGCSGIFATTGFEHPLYYYKITPIAPDQLIPGMYPLQWVLKTICHTRSSSEVCGLYLSKEFRKEGLGKLLSLSRFHFIARHPERFTNTIFAEMRGFVDNKGTSPFWENIGRKFLDVEFSTIMQWRDEKRELLPHILPEYPIYIQLLPKDVQDVMGHTHPHTKPALAMLHKEGFEKTDEIDVFDAGPKIQASTNLLRTVKQAKMHKVIKIEEIGGLPELVSNGQIDFRAIHTPIIQKENGVIINAQAAKALNVDVGDEVLYG